MGISKAASKKRVTFYSSDESSGQISGINEKYFGQKPPGSEPEIFSPGFISLKDKIEYSSTFSPEGNEFYFSRLVAKDKFTIFVTKRASSGWGNPEIAGFSGAYFNNEPYITPDGKRIYWGSKRPLPDGRTDFGTWYMDKEGEAWGKPKLFKFVAMYITSTRDKKLYFTDRGPGGAVIAWTALENGKYEKKHWLGKPIISNYYDGHPFISQDESFLIFDSENSPVYTFSVRIVKPLQQNWKNRGQEYVLTGNTDQRLIIDEGQGVVFLKIKQRNGNVKKLIISRISIQRFPGKMIRYRLTDNVNLAFDLNHNNGFLSSTVAFKGVPIFIMATDYETLQGRRNTNILRFKGNNSGELYFDRSTQTFFYKSLKQKGVWTKVRKVKR